MKSKAQSHITNHLAVTQNLREQDSDTDESEEDEVVTCDEYDEEEDILAEIGSVQNEEEYYEEHDNYANYFGGLTFFLEWGVSQNW